MVTGKQRADKFEVILIIGLLFCALPLYLYRIKMHPGPWFDEGLNLQAAKNVALYGHYGLRSSEGFAAFHPAIQTGPTVLLPIVLVFRLAGVGVLQARLVAVFYSISALVVFFWLVRSVCNRKVALLPSFLLISTLDRKFTSFVLMGRQVLGEIPALAFFWLGTVFWFRAWDSTNRTALLRLGLLWGLTMLTKAQFAITLPAALFLFWLFDRILNKKLEIHQVLIPLLVSGLCMLVWYGCQALSMRFTDFWQQTADMGSAGGMRFLRFSLRKAGSAIFRLLDSSLILFGVPGMLYTVGSSFGNGEETERRQVL